MQPTTIIYLTIVIALLICFIIKLAKIKSEFSLRFLKKLHRPVFILLFINTVCIQFGWSIIGPYTNQIFILITVLTGIFTYVFLRNQSKEIKPPGYYKIFFRVCLILTILGAVPVIVPYGGGLLFQAFARNYTTYNLANSYFLKREQYGINHCFDLYLCKQYFLVEQDIPIYQRTDIHYDCFGDLMQVAITESNDKGLKARITMSYNSDITDLILNYRNQKLEAINHVWYGTKTYSIDFSGLRYKRNYSLTTEYESLQER